jgi:thiamine pyrophosphate-dependent acetolactate synthase large subunit-like protein
MLLDRNHAVPALVGDPKHFLMVAGLAGTAYELAHITNDGDNLFALGGAMGSALSIGLGLALAQPTRRVLVATGDGELLMNVSALATVGIMAPPNLAILCVDNGHYGETGFQRSHTSLGVDLERMAIGANIGATMTIDREDQLAAGSKMLRDSNRTCFVVVRVSTADPPKDKLSFDAPASRLRFRRALGVKS